MADNCALPKISKCYDDDDDEEEEEEEEEGDDDDDDDDDAPTTTGIISVFIFHILVISISRSLYLDDFSKTSVQVFLSEGIPWLRGLPWILEVPYLRDHHLYPYFPTKSTVFSSEGTF